MASIYFREKQGSGVWWIKARSAKPGSPLVRLSLGTRDEAFARLLKKRIELELELKDPVLLSLPIEESLRKDIGLEVTSQAPEAAVAPIPEERKSTPASEEELGNGNALPITEAIKIYHAHCKDENSEAWVKNKVSCLRSFFGSKIVEAATGLKSTEKVNSCFKGKVIGELTGPILKQFLDEKDVSTKTKRHYREVFHDFFAVLTRYEYYTPKSLFHPNPVGVLCSRHTSPIVLSPSASLNIRIFSSVLYRLPFMSGSPFYPSQTNSSTGLIYVDHVRSSPIWSLQITFMEIFGCSSLME